MACVAWVTSLSAETPAGLATCLNAAMRSNPRKRIPAPGFLPKGIFPAGPR